MKYMPLAAHPSFDLLCSNYANAIRKRIRYYIKDESLAKDLHQEVLIKIWKGLRDFDPDKGSLYTWIIVITNNTCIDHLRTGRGKITAGLDVAGNNEDQTLPERDFRLRQELLCLAQRLSFHQRNILFLIYFQGYTQSQVAYLLQIPLGTVKARQRSGLIALRKMLRKK